MKSAFCTKCIKCAILLSFVVENKRLYQILSFPTDCLPWDGGDKYSLVSGRRDFVLAGRRLKKAIMGTRRQKRMVRKALKFTQTLEKRKKNHGFLAGFLLGSVNFEDRGTNARRSSQLIFPHACNRSCHFYFL